MILGYLSLLIWVGICILLAYFVYGLNFTLALGFLAWSIVIYLISIFIVIPIAGFVILYFEVCYWSPFLMQQFLIYPTWLTTVTMVIFNTVTIIMQIYFIVLIILFIKMAIESRTYIIIK